MKYTTTHLIAVAMAIGVIGCIEPEVTLCREGRLCPGGTVCDEIHGQCVLFDQMVICAGVDDGEDCDIAGQPVGICRDEVCLRAGCGDHFVRGSEQCDTTVPDELDDCTEHGFHQPGSVSCSDQCTFDVSRCSDFCGDGELNGDEPCDANGTGDPADDVFDGYDCLDFGFYQPDGLACSLACTLDVSECEGYCGDDALNGDEDCDGAELGGIDDCLDLGFYQSGPVSCTANCGFDTSACSQRCGDGELNGGEACDSNGTIAPDDDLFDDVDCLDFGFYQADGLACSLVCTIDVSGCTGYCGDEVATGAEQCDGDDLAGVTGCTDLGYYDADPVTCGPSCTYDRSQCDLYCGDGLPNGDEPCDPGPTSDPGDDDLGGRDCTDFGFYDTAGLRCSLACTYDITGCTGYCGDGVISGSEDCDTLGTGDPGDDLFTGDCTDLGYYYPTVIACSPLCSFDHDACTGYCGDRIPDPEEICEGKRPPGESCVDFGYESGSVGCNGMCGPTFGRCSRSQLEQVVVGYNGNLNAVWTSAPDDVYAVGSVGTILHYDGVSWTPTTHGSSTLWGIWGFGPSDIYAVGADGTILHYDGDDWSPMTSGTTAMLSGVWGSSPGDVYAVGLGTILHLSGGVWSEVDDGAGKAILAVWGTGPNDVFAVGASGTIRHYDGSWSAMDSGTTSHLRGVWASAPDDVFAVGNDGTILHYDGTWSQMASGTSAWLYAVWGSGPRDIYVAGSAGLLFHYDGSVWVSLAGTTPDYLYGVYGSGPADVYAVGVSGQVLHRWGSRWQPTPVDISNPLSATWGSGPDDVFAVGASGTIRHWNGSAWSPMTSGTAANLSGLWGSSPSDVFTVGRFGTVLHYHDGTWNPMDSGSVTEWLWAVGGTGPTDVFAVGTTGVDGVIRHYDGAWSLMYTAEENLTNVWVTAWNDVFAVGASGTILHYDGNAWQPMESGTSRLLRGIWASGPTDAFAVGLGNTILHYDGTEWTPMVSPAPATTDFYTVAGTGPADVFAAGSSGTVYHFDGLFWAPTAAVTSEQIFGIWAGEEVFAVGEGSPLRRDRRCMATENVCNDGIDQDCDGLVDCADPDCAAASFCLTGGLCAGAVAIVCDSSTVGTTVGGPARLDAYACDDWYELGREAVYRLDPGIDGEITVSLSALDKDLDLIILREGAGGACNPYSPDCLAASSTTTSESASFDAAAGEVYYLVVDGYAANAGTFLLDVSCP